MTKPERHFPKAKKEGQTVVAEWPKNSGEVVRLSVGKYRGHTIVNLRVWYKSSDATFLPGRNGISLAIMHVAKIRKALRKAEEVFKAGESNHE